MYNKNRFTATIIDFGVPIGTETGFFLLGCYMGVTGVLKACYRGVTCNFTNVLQGCYMGITGG